MGIRLDVIEDSAVVDTLNVIIGPDAKLITHTTTSSKVVKNTTDPPMVIEVLKGQPGVTNVVVSDTPPTNPFENMIWIDTSGG